jgi:hypothetical protein
MVEREAAESPAPSICNELHAFAGTARGVMTGPGGNLLCGQRDYERQHPGTG